jgi:hypothetical protein
MVSRGRYVFVYTSLIAYSLQSSNGRSYPPTAPKADWYGNRVLRVLLGIGGGLREGGYCFALIRTKALSAGKPVREVESGA